MSLWPEGRSVKRSNCSSLVFVVFVGGIVYGTSSCAPVKDKWLVYELNESQVKTALYVGYKTFPDEKKQTDSEKRMEIFKEGADSEKLTEIINETDPERRRKMITDAYDELTKHAFGKTEETKLKDIRDAYNQGTLALGKPVITEKDESHILVYLPGATPSAKCVREEKALNLTDAAVVPPTPATRAPSGVKNVLEAPEPAKALKELMEKEIPQQQQTRADRDFYSLFCNLTTRGKGGVQVTYKISTTTTKDGKEKEELKLDDSVHVHALYRFRVMAGPVYSTLIKKNKDYKVITNSSGQQIVSSSSKNEAPVNFPLLLKIYWAPEGRDILNDDPWFLYRFNPIVGINVFDNPLKNFYLGMSFEPPVFRGLDIVGGAHWSKQARLTGGFSEGQVTTSSTVPTKDTFVNGWFVGATVDIGVFGAWLTNSVAQSFKK